MSTGVSRPWARSILAGAVFGLVETAVTGVLLLVVFAFLLDDGPLVGLVVLFAVGALFLLPSGALVGMIFGLLNGAIVRRRWGQGRLSVGVVTGITLAAYGLLLFGSGDSGPILGLAVVPAAARGLHLHYEQRQSRRLLMSVAPETGAAPGATPAAE